MAQTRILRSLYLLITEKQERCLAITPSSASSSPRVALLTMALLTATLLLPYCGSPYCYRIVTLLSPHCYLTDLLPYCSLTVTSTVTLLWLSFLWQEDDELVLQILFALYRFLQA